MGPFESHEKKVFRKNPNMGLQAILIPKNSLGFLIGKHPLLWFFAQRWLSYVHLYLLASEALHIGRIGNMTKPLWILYQLGKLLLNFG